MPYSNVLGQTGIVYCQNSKIDAFKPLNNYSITNQSYCPLLPLTLSSSEQVWSVPSLVNGYMIHPGLSGRLKGKSFKITIELQQAHRGNRAIHQQTGTAR